MGNYQNCCNGDEKPAMTQEEADRLLNGKGRGGSIQVNASQRSLNSWRNPNQNKQTNKEIPQMQQNLYELQQIEKILQNLSLEQQQQIFQGNQYQQHQVLTPQEKDALLAHLNGIQNDYNNKMQVEVSSQAIGAGLLMFNNQQQFNEYDAEDSFHGNNLKSMNSYRGSNTKKLVDKSKYDQKLEYNSSYNQNINNIQNQINFNNNQAHNKSCASAGGSRRENQMAQGYSAQKNIFKQETSSGQETQQLNNQLADLSKISQLSMIDQRLRDKMTSIIPLHDLKAEESYPIILSNRGVYLGGWKNGMREGKGTMDWPDGSRYVGDWQSDKAHGYGIMFHSNGDKYEGYWVEDKAEGKGNYTHFNGSRYSGYWLDDKQHGFGKETWQDGAVYEGDYYLGKKHGKGKMIFADGSIYEGSFQSNEIDGFGVYQWFDGKVYEGQWKNNMMNGKGHLRWPNGKEYIGDFVNDQRQNLGIFKWGDGREYEGQWYQGKQHGYGEFLMKDGTKWQGNWYEGKRIEKLEIDK